MSRLLSLWLAAVLAMPVLANQVAAPSPLTEAQILEKNAAARGGIDAWRKIQTMAWAGHVESGNAQAQSVPFVLEMQRPNKTHFEFVGMSQRMLRIFNGNTGWKLRPTQGGGIPEVLTFSADESRFAREEQVIDGLLLDHEAKGFAVSLEGMDMIEGHPAYRMQVRLASGSNHHVWIDARSFLEVKADRESRGTSGAANAVAVFYRDYREFGGLQIPCVIETSRGPAGSADRLVIERVSLNPPLDDREFTKPGMPVRRKAVTIDIEPVPPDGTGRVGQ